jgi:hypothetical protein
VIVAEAVERKKRETNIEIEVVVESETTIKVIVITVRAMIEAEVDPKGEGKIAEIRKNANKENRAIDEATEKTVNKILQSHQIFS